MCLFIFPLCKFFDSEVQVLEGFLTRPVTGNNAHDHARQCEEQDDQYHSFHMISVPCILPSMSEIAIAEMNIPAMIQNKSISTIPVCRSSHPFVSSTTVQVLSVRPVVCSLSSLTSQCPYSQGYCYHVVCDDNQLYHTSI